MSEISVLNRSDLDDADVAFAAAACDLQLREHLVPAWPGVEYLPVRFYADAKDLPVAEDICRLMVISQTIDVPGLLGYHNLDPLVRGVVLAQGSATSVTLSHECLEMAADPLVDQWRTRPGGSMVALEVCDPVEADSYEVAVSILGETRAVAVSNFVTPAWFDERVMLMFDQMRRVSAPFALSAGGYCVVRDAKGNVSDIWGRSDAAAIVRKLRKRWNSTSRSYRRGVR